jgi:mannitol/fructose-specific phosphotransferase system IIA component (Ntr-type)
MLTLSARAAPRSVMNILDILSPKAIKVPLAAGDKKAAIEELVDLIAGAGMITQPEDLKRVVWEREQQRTTGIGEGLAIPHGKVSGSRSLVIAIGRPAQPIDFNSIDNKPVKLIVLLASPPDKPSDHIQALGKISRLMADPKFRFAAYSAESAEALYELFRNAEK